MILHNFEYNNTLWLEFYFNYYAIILRYMYLFYLVVFDIVILMIKYFPFKNMEKYRKYEYEILYWTFKTFT